MTSFKIFPRLFMLIASLNLIFLNSHATPIVQVSQISSQPDDLSPRTEASYNAATALVSHSKRAQITRGTFYRGLWTLALQATTFLAQGPSSSVVPASDMENFAHQVLETMATNIATGAAEKNAFGWSLGGISITFASWADPATHVAPSVPWAVVQEFVNKFVLWRAQRGSVIAFSGSIWGPGGECVTVVLKAAAYTRIANSIWDSASEIPTKS